MHYSAWSKRWIDALKYMKTNNTKKLIVGFAAIAVLAVLAWFVAISLNPEARQEREARKYLEDLQEQYENDTYGGKTPEETLALFIAALEKGDIELASKYFVIEEQEERLNYFREVENAENMVALVAELSYPYEKREFGSGNSRYIFDIYNLDADTHMQLDIGNGTNGIWKIVDM